MAKSEGLAGAALAAGETCAASGPERSKVEEAGASASASSWKCTQALMGQLSGRAAARGARSALEPKNP